MPEDARTTVDFSSFGKTWVTMETTDFYLGGGDTLDPLEATLRKGGLAVNLTGATVTLKLKRVLDTTATLITRTCTLVDALNGVVKYTWLSGDFASLLPGSYEGQFLVTFSGGGTQHYPNFAKFLVQITATL